MGAIKYEQPVVGKQSHPLPEIAPQVDGAQTISNSDPLTGLLCRSAFEVNKLTEDFDKDLAAAFIIDFDRFADVNEQYGRAVGDFVLAIQAERLQQSKVARKRIVYRYEGDRFLELIFSDTSLDEDTLMEMARELQKELHQPVKMKQSAVSTTCCIGMALKNKSINVAQLATEALLAVEDAKHRGTGNIYLRELSIAG